MPPVSAPYGSDLRRVSRGGQPVVNRRTDPAALERRVALPFMAGNQQQHAVPARNRPLQRPVDRFPCPVQAVAVEVEGAVRVGLAGSKPSIPTPVEGRALKVGRPSGRRELRPRRGHPSLRLRGGRRFHDSRWFQRFSRQRANGRGDLRPKIGLFSGQLAHAPPCPWAGGATPCPSLTFRPRSLRRRLPRPRRCRTGWRP